MKHVPPSDLELQVLGVLWKRGASTARQVLEALPDQKKRAYTTVLTVMQVMEKKGLLTHTRDGQANVYQPTVTRKQVMGPMLRTWVGKLFGGSPATAVQQLISETEATPDDIEEIKRFLDRYEKGER